MLSIGSRRGLACAGRRASTEHHTVPVFLCPHLQECRSGTVPLKRRDERVGQYRVASTSTIPHQPNQAGPHDRGNSPPDSAGHFQPRTGQVRPQDLVAGESAIKTRLYKLDIIDQALQDILTRPQEFNSRAESLVLLEEGRWQLSEEFSTRIVVIQERVQMITFKLVCAYLQIGSPTIAITILQGLTGSWTKETEDQQKPLWKTAVQLAYSKKKYKVAIQMTEMLSKHASDPQDWMRIARFHSLLRLAERGEQSKPINRADNVWLDFEKAGQVVPKPVLILLLRSQIKRGDAALVTGTIEAMKRHSYTLDPPSWEQLMLSPLRAPKGRGLVKLLLSSFSDATSAAEELISYFAFKRDVRNCLRILRMLGLFSGSQRPVLRVVEPTAQVYEPVILMFARSAQPDRALQFFNLALASEGTGDYTSSFVEVAYSLNSCRRSAEALALGTRLINSPLHHDYSQHTGLTGLPQSMVISPSRRVYATLISSVSLLDDLHAIVPLTRALLLEMFTHQKLINGKIRTSLARIVVRLSRNTSWKGMLVLLGNLFQRPSLQPAPLAMVKEWEKFLSVLRKEGVGDFLLISAWKKMPAHLQKELAESNEWFGMQYSWQELQQDLVASGIREQITPASQEDLRLEMVSTPAGYAMRLRVYAVVRRDHNAAQAIFRSMIEHGYSPSMHHVAPIIEGLVLNGRIEDADAVKQRAMDELTDKEIPKQIYAALCRGYGQIGAWNAICRLAVEMRENGVYIDNSFQRAFKTARRMLKQQRQSEQGEEGKDGTAMKDINKVVRQRHVNKTLDRWHQHQVTAAFLHMFHTGRVLQAQEHVAKAFDKGMVADALLRDELSRADNWLRKKIRLGKTRGLGSGLRKDVQRQAALQLCKENRERARQTPEMAEMSKLQAIAERRERDRMVELLQDALGSTRLLDEARAKMLSADAAGGTGKDNVQ